MITHRFHELLGVGTLVLALLIAGAALAQRDAGRFGFPVGQPTVAPLETETGNGFRITQHFATRCGWEDGGASGGWCQRDGRQDSGLRDSGSCEGAGGTWRCGHSGCDLANGQVGDPIRAIADGKIVDVRRDVTGYGHVFATEHQMPDGSVVEAWHAHVQDDERFRALRVGQPVRLRQVLASVGNSGGVPPHLHQILSTRPGDLPPGYFDADPADRLGELRDPLLFVDERQRPQFVGLVPDRTWFAFTPDEPTVARLAFLAAGGRRMDLRRAAEAGWIHSAVWEWDGTEWTEHRELDHFLMREGATFYIWAWEADLDLTVLLPASTYREARAMQDLRDAVADDPRFGGPDRGSFTVDDDWSEDWVLTYAWFRFRQGWAPIAQASHRDVPIARLTTLRDPERGGWTPWTWAH